MNYIEDLRKLVGTRPLRLVGSVVIILDVRGRILLQKRTTTPIEIWGLPGGLMELGEATEETAREHSQKHDTIIYTKIYWRLI